MSSLNVVIEWFYSPQIAHSIPPSDDQYGMSNLQIVSIIPCAMANAVLILLATHL